MRYIENSPNAGREGAIRGYIDDPSQYPRIIHTEGESMKLILAIGWTLLVCVTTVSDDISIFEMYLLCIILTVWAFEGKWKAQDI